MSRIHWPGPDDPKRKTKGGSQSLRANRGGSDTVDLGDKSRSALTATSGLIRGQGPVGSKVGALEVIDYRTRGASGKVDWVADNATVALAVVSEPVPFAEVPSLADIGVEFFGGAESMAAGRGSLVMDDPLRALHCLPPTSPARAMPSTQATWI